jgi:hypothetical protein
VSATHQTASPASPAGSTRTVRLAGRDGEEHVFTGYALGVATSRAEQHTHATRYAAPGDKCSACRWFSVGIYRVFDAPDGADARPRARGYVVQTVGESVVPGEQRLARVQETASAYEVLELLTVRRRGAEPFITPQSLRALAQAAHLDDDLRDAYVNRAVV